MPLSGPSSRLRDTTFPRWQRGPPGRAQVTCWVSARSRRAQGRGRAEAAERARSDSRAPGGSVASRRRTRIPARLPGPLPQGSGAKRRLLPNNSDLYSRNNASGEEESSEAAAPRARDRTTYWRARVRAAPGRSAPEGKGHEAGRPVGVAARGEARTAEVPGAQRRGPSPVAAGKKAGATRPPPPAMNRVFSQCVVQAWLPRARVRGRRPARPEPAAVTQGRPRSLCSGPWRPLPTSPPAPPPFRQPRLGGSGLAGCLGSAAAAPVTATPRLRAGPAPPPLSAGAATLTRISLGPKGLRRRLRLVAGPGPR